MNRKITFSTILCICLIDTCLCICCNVVQSTVGSYNYSINAVVPIAQVSNDDTCLYTTCPLTDTYCVTLKYRNYKMDSKHFWSNYFILYDCPSLVSVHFPNHNLSATCTDSHKSGYVNLTGSTSSNSAYPLTDYGYNCCQNIQCKEPDLPGLNGTSTNFGIQAIILSILSICFVANKF